MELFISLRGGYKAECAGCLSRVKIIDVKVILGKCYCPTCYPMHKKNDKEINETTE